MSVISEKLKDFIAMYMVMSKNIMNWGVWVFCPFVRFEGIVYFERELGVISWYSGVAYSPNMKEFVILCVNNVEDNQLYCLLNDFSVINEEFDGTAESIVSYIKRLNRFENNVLKDNACVSIYPRYRSVHLSDCMSLHILKSCVLV